jgi:hypothetical protein
VVGRADDGGGGRCFFLCLAFSLLLSESKFLVQVCSSPSGCESLGARVTPAVGRGYFAAALQAAFPC